MLWRHIPIVVPKGQLRILFELAVLFSLCMAVPCAAQGVRKGQRGTSETDRPASDAHSFVELFTKLERDWTLALQRKDRAALDKILAPEFMLRDSEDPENPLSRADWIQREITSCDFQSFSQRAIEIRAFLGVAVVSFVESRREAIDGKGCSGEYLISDVWEVNHGQWQASERYVAPVSNHPVGVTNERK